LSAEKQLRHTQVSNICDRAYIGLAPTIGIFAPLLQEPIANPHATLITLFMNAVEEEFMNSGEDHDMNVIMKEMALVAEYLPHRPNMNRNDPYFLKLLFAKPFVRDVERYLGK
jgi:hypothetical protein